MPIERVRNDILTIGTSNVVAIEEQFDTVTSFLSIINTSTGGQKVSLAVGQEAVSGTGFVMSPGGFFQESRDNGYRPTKQRINLISDLAGATVAIQHRCISKVIGDD